MADTDRRQQRGRGRPRQEQRVEEGPKYDERVIDLARTVKVVKGGRHFSFRAVVVVGDNQGLVGVGMGKAREVSEAIRKGTEHARKTMFKVKLLGNTLPHPVLAEFGASKVMLKPATPGTGVIAAGGVRAVLEAAGVKDVLTKSLGSSNKLNTVRATIAALQSLRDAASVAALRNKNENDLLPPWSRPDGKNN
jgi:small subunit ribosomal protein S5